MLGDALMEKGLITKSQLAEALAEQEKKPGEKLGIILVKLGFMGMDELVKFVKAEEKTR